MNRIPWEVIKESIRRDRGAPAMRSSEEFWSDFRARARLHPQVNAVPARNTAIYRWALAAACGIVLLGVALFQVAVTPGSAMAGTTTIKSVEVVASHGGVLIMNDAATQSTILWIVDMKPENGDGDSS